VLADLRDISIILLAIESIIIGIILLLLLWQVRLLVLLLRDEIKPILKDTQETTRTVKSTTRFVGVRVAKPVVKTASFFAGVRQVVRAMTEPLYPEAAARRSRSSGAGSSGAPASPSTPPAPSSSPAPDVES